MGHVQIRSREGAMRDLQTQCSSFTRARLEVSPDGKGIVNS